MTVGLDAVGTNIYGGTVTLSGTNRVNIRSVVNHQRVSDDVRGHQSHRQHDRHHGRPVGNRRPAEPCHRRLLRHHHRSEPDPAGADQRTADAAWVGTDGTNPTWWDENTTVNWVGFTGPAKFNTADAVLFNDTGHCDRDRRETDRSAGGDDHQQRDQELHVHRHGRHRRVRRLEEGCSRHGDLPEHGR